MPRPRRTRLLALACGLGLLVASPLLAQSGGGGSSGGSSGGAAGGAASDMSGGAGAGNAAAGTAPGATPGPAGEGRRAQTERQLRDAGVAPSPEEEQRQLRDLNAITRQVAPGVTPPAPDVARR